jgi:hypothetical protein
MIKRVTRSTRAKAPKMNGRKEPAQINDEEILRAATIYLIRTIGGLFVATGLRAVESKGRREWIVTVTLRYPSGHAGTVGELRYDGRDFSLLTEDSVIDRRVRQIAADPEGVRRWNEYRAATLRAGKA